MKTLLVTGSSGLIGSEVCQYFANDRGYAIHGIDNNQRAVFFGPQGDTRWNQQRLHSPVMIVPRRYRSTTSTPTRRGR
jgi:CDP-paratose 2-epimerase